MRAKTILIILIVLALLVLGYLIYVNWGKITGKISSGSGGSSSGNSGNDNSGTGNISATFDDDVYFGTAPTDIGDLDDSLLLQFGSIGDEVRWLQYLGNGLYRKKGDNDKVLSIDGIFGLKTRAMVQQFAGKASVTLNEFYIIVSKQTN